MGKKSERLSDQLRAAVEVCGMTRYRIWRETGVSQEVLSRFMRRKGGLSMRAMDKIGEYLGLKITFEQKPRKKKGSS